MVATCRGKMMTSKLVISLDFEMFWGVADVQTLATYGANVKGEWKAVPRLLALFRRYGIKVTWATVGMAMCRHYQHWRAIRPTLLPHYVQPAKSPYAMDRLVRDHPDLFFARPLVQQILATPGQELATHTYSHFYCGDPAATPEQFAADLACAQDVAAELGVRCRSLVFPRNQLVGKFLSVLPGAGIEVYRGNTEHWLYQSGDAVKGGIAGRALRFADACVPISGNRSVSVAHHGELVNVPASFFFYPWSKQQRAAAPLRLFRLKRGMTAAAQNGDVCHLWWHPHNFGVNLEKNLALLESVLQHYAMLADRYGMESACMGDFASRSGTRSDDRAHGPAGPDASGYSS